MRTFGFVALAGFLLTATTAHAADPAEIAKEARAWRTAHERTVLAEFAELLAIPNVASDAANIGKNAKAIEAMFARRGAATQVLTLHDSSAPPIVVADVIVARAARTIAFYAHYDGQPVDAMQWRGAPWVPVMRDAAGKEVDWQHAGAIDPEWRLYARSSGDDKAPIIAMAATLDALREIKRIPSVNLRFVFEGEEEAGSPHLAAYLAEHEAALRADAWVLCDGPVHQSRRAELFFGARGVLSAELTVYGPVKALHDGHYGNWVPNPIVLLTHLIDSMRDESGRILIDGFYDDVRVPSDAEKAALAKIPEVESMLLREFQLGATEGNGAALNELLMRPALNIRGIQSGHVGAQASNTIQTEAQASIDFRLVPDETPESIKARVERHIASRGYTIVRTTPDAEARLAHPRIAKLEWGAGYPPARTSLDLPFSRDLTSILTASGHPPVLLPILGGSIPMYLFQQPHGAPVVGLPIANHDDNQHAPNENIRLQNLWDAIEIYAALFTSLPVR